MSPTIVSVRMPIINKQRKLNVMAVPFTGMKGLLQSREFNYFNKLSNHICTTLSSYLLRNLMKKNNTLITPEGLQVLKNELSYLWKKKRPAITQAVSDAAALGDRSENAEYKEGKRLLRETDRRIRYLTKQLNKLTPVHYATEQEGKVWFGAWVEVENENNEKIQCRIVGTDEIDPKKGYISIQSPMANALIGNQVDDEVVVITPKGRNIWFITQIQSLPFDDHS